MPTSSSQAWSDKQTLPVGVVGFGAAVIPPREPSCDRGSLGAGLIMRWLVLHAASYSSPIPWLVPLPPEVQIEKWPDRSSFALR